MAFEQLAPGIYITCFSLPSTLNTQCRYLIFSLFTMISDDLTLKKTYQYFLKTKANVTKKGPKHSQGSCTSMTTKVEKN